MSKIKIGEVTTYTEDIVGYALMLDDNVTHGYGLMPGLYPIMYFEEYSVQIAVYMMGDPDLLWIHRNDFEWIPLPKQCSCPVT